MSYLVTSLLILTMAVALLIPALIHVARKRDEFRECLDAARLEVVASNRQSDYYRMACEHASDGLLIQDMQGRIVWANPAYLKIHGRDEASVIGRNPLEFVLPPDKTPSHDAINSFRYDPDDPAFKKLQLHENYHKDGYLFWNQLNVSFRRSPEGRENAILVCRDVTEDVERANRLTETQSQLQYEATHDSLTGVSNRAAFLDFLSNTLQTNGGAQVGLLHVDLDNFKQVNDTHGHSAGDAVLIQTAQTLQDLSAQGDLVARVGGDEFVIVCTQIGSVDQLAPLARAVVDALEEPFEWSNRLLNCEASIGGAHAGFDTPTAETLLLHADFALYEAKREGRNTVVLYDDDLHQHHMKELQLAVDLAEAIDTGKMDYFLQPKLNVKTGQVSGFETLIRWFHPDRGMIAPDDFLPLVRTLGMMGQLDLLAMTAALEHKAALDKAGFSNISVAFNASPELLNHPDFINRLVWGVEAASIDRSQICVEVLESTNFGIDDPTSANAAIVTDLRSAGFQVQLDDFGIGFAGLTHLSFLNISGVKIDRGLVQDILEDGTSFKIVRKIVELCNDLELYVIAEGVETQAIAASLADMGCDAIQGYWLSRPMPAADVIPWLAANRNSDFASSA